MEPTLQAFRSRSVPMRPTLVSDSMFGPVTPEILPAQDLDNASTTALMPSLNVSITATYTAASGGSDKIRFYPRSDDPSRMAGGVFEGTNEKPPTNYTWIHTVATTPPVA